MPVLTRAQVSQYAQAAGFSGNSLNIILAIAMAESGYNTSAQHLNSNGTLDRGLYQINTVHTDVSDQCAYDALCSSKAVYAISSQGTNFNPWTTYTSGAYKQYLSGSSSGSSSANISTASSNTYPKGQCTWWACERYHSLTGYYIPWKGNANQWAGQAESATGWQNSSKPSVPSIVVLQAGVQGAGTPYGHVAVAEKINPDGTIYASNQNWAGITYPNTTYVTFTAGSGISFVSATSAGSTTGGTNTGGTNTGGTNTGGSYTSLLSQVHTTLVNTPGFYGMALALDEAEQFPGWVNLVDPSVQAFGVNMDISGFIRSIGATITDNFVPFAIRASLALLGLFILYALFLKVVFDVGEKVAPIVAEAAM